MSLPSEWRIELPKVAEWINSNDRLHYHEKAKRTKAWRDEADYVARDRGGYFTGRVRVVVTIHKDRGGRWDAGNLYPTAKAIVDGLVDAGVIYDDSNTYVEGPDLRAGDKRATPCVVVDIYKIEGEAA